MERAADRRRLEAEARLAVDIERGRREEARVGGVDQRPLPVAGRGAARDEIAIVAPMRRRGEVKLGVAEPRRIDDPAIDAQHVVAFVDIEQIVVEDAELRGHRAAGQCSPRAPSRRSKSKASVKAARSMNEMKRDAGQLVERLEIVVLAGGHGQPVRGAPGNRRVGDLVDRFGKLDLEDDRRSRRGAVPSTPSRARRNSSTEPRPAAATPSGAETSPTSY